MWALTAEHAPFLSSASTLGVDALGIGSDLSTADALVEGDAQTLSTHTRGLYSN